MKSKTKVSILFALAIIFLFFSIFNSSFSKNIIAKNNYLEFNEKDQVQIKQAGFWNLTESKISIDDNVQSKNWSYTASHYDWCSGSGSWTDPYVIENVTIDGQGLDNCIEIKNSDVYFIVRNCSLYNSSSSSNAGIKLDNVDNGKIINNNCSDNSRYGIYLYYSDNNTLSGNTATNNRYGIRLWVSNNNALSGNNASNNYNGIILDNSNNNALSGNTANNNGGGISLQHSNNNALSGNNASNNYNGILLDNSNNNALSGNTANNNDYGILLDDGDNNNLSGNLMNFCGISLSGSLAELASHIIDDTNLVNNKPVYYYVNELGLGSSNFTGAGQIILIKCNNSIISGLNLSNVTMGIQLIFSNNNTLSGNTASHNYRYGLYLYCSDNNTLSGNNANNNYNGILLDNSDNNTLSGNSANNNGGGISLQHSNNNALSGNNASNNYNGILLDNSNNNALSGNNVSNNNGGGISLQHSNNNTLSGNTANNNGYGIRLWVSNSNTLLGNTASNNNRYGIILYDSNNNTLTGNLMYLCGIFLSGSLAELSSQTIDDKNLVNNKPVYYFVNETGLGLSNFTNAGQIFLFNCNNSLISGLNLSNGTMGMYLSYSNNNTLSGNTASNNNFFGIYLYFSDNNTLTGNMISNNNNGIRLDSSNNNTLSGNTANNNDGGIDLRYSNNNTLSGNTANNNTLHGIYLRESNNNTLSGNNIGNNEYYGINLLESNNNILSENLMTFCGIYLSGSLVEMNSHSIDDTNLVNNKPVYYYVNESGLGSSNFTNAGQIILINCNNSIIVGLNLSNGTMGMYLGYSNNNNLIENIANNNSIGIYLFYSNNNTLTGNIANNNAIGIILFGSNNTVSGNTASFNYQGGIHIGDSNNNKLSGNKISNNTYGLRLDSSNNNTLSGNTINNNSFGISLWYSNNNTLSGNLISNNSIGITIDPAGIMFDLSGILVSPISKNNKIFLNNFINNNFNAYDNGSDNMWDNGFTGNHWDDYLGVDANDDGIGDTPYIIPGTAGSQDNFPIYDKIVPVITIIFPLPDCILGFDAPNYSISFNGLDSDTIWYTLDGGRTNYTITSLTGTFNQLAWDGLSEGSIIIRFYANDTAGNIGSAVVTIEKDISAPVITVISPLPNEEIGLVTPNYNITIDELNLDSIWYTLDGGITNHTITSLTGAFNQTTWGALSEGTVTIKFYANDTAGNVGSAFVTIEKDISAPVIIINNPLPDSIFGLDAPNYNISINELNLDAMWYTFDGGITNYTIAGLTGTFNQTVWGALSEGSLTIRFYANDTAGNIGFKDVEIVKEIPDDPVNVPIISFGNYYIIFTFLALTIFSLTILRKQKSLD